MSVRIYVRVSLHMLLLVRLVASHLLLSPGPMEGGADWMICMAGVVTGPEAKIKLSS
jgi:hypothetical protein